MAVHCVDGRFVREYQVNAPSAEIVMFSMYCDVALASWSTHAGKFFLLKQMAKAIYSVTLFIQRERPWTPKVHSL